jgi:hypothetical protein
MTEYEYCHISFHHDEGFVKMMEKINELGMDGWRVISKEREDSFHYFILEKSHFD